MKEGYRTLDQRRRSVLTAIDDGADRDVRRFAIEHRLGSRDFHSAVPQLHDSRIAAGGQRLWTEIVAEQNGVIVYIGEV